MSKLINIVAFFRKNILQVLSLVILFLCLILTWFFFQSKNKFPQGIHVGIQEEFRRVIEKQLLKNNPLIENIEFQELWTETTGQSRQIKAVFKYTFHDSNSQNGEPVKVTVRGSAFINQLPSEEKKWQIGSFDVDQTELDFENQVIVIHPEESDSEFDGKRNLNSPENN